MHLEQPKHIGPNGRAEGACPSAGCGGANERIPADIDEKIRNHPCFSEDAHHYYARMHVAVAPACNIQCHYCNRKYDCANESRPGVVSEVLSPRQAVKKVKAVAAKIPQLTVLGIAGPGDPLANPERTFATFRALSHEAPDIKLCVSTNGLALPDAVDELCRHNIGHVTITINCVDPEIGAQIYPWVFWNNRRIKGIEGVEILIEQQQRGLAMLVERGVLVKVNSVLIPGVNDAHLKEVSAVVKAKGAFLHNLMPLIAAPEHGTFYGLMGQRSPTGDELRALQDACGGDMRMMRHCRQCRADAVGLIGQDRQNEFTTDRIDSIEIDYARAMEERRQVHADIEVQRALRRQTEQETNGRRDAQTQMGAPGETFVLLSAIKRIGRADRSREREQAKTEHRAIRVAVATSGQGLVDCHFGEARQFSIYEASATAVSLLGVRTVGRYCSGPDACGDASATLAGTIEALAGCEAVLCAKIGYEPWVLLEKAGILPNGEHAMEPIEQAVAAVYSEMIAQGLVEAPAVTYQRMSA